MALSGVRVGGIMGRPAMVRRNVRTAASGRRQHAVWLMIVGALTARQAVDRSGQIARAVRSAA